MFNTLRYARALETVGVPREQAEAHVQIIAEIIEGDLATKQDIKDLEYRLQSTEHRIVIKVSAVMATMFTIAIGVLALLLKSS